MGFLPHPRVPAATLESAAGRASALAALAKEGKPPRPSIQESSWSEWNDELWGDALPFGPVVPAAAARVLAELGLTSADAVPPFRAAKFLTSAPTRGS